MVKYLISALCVFLTLSSTSLAQEEAPPAKEPPPQKNSFLAPKVQALVKSAMRVVKEVEGQVTLASPSGTSFANKTQILFFRKRGPRVEMIATGEVVGEKTDAKTGAVQILVDVDRDSVIKFPLTGDFAALLSDPNALNAPNKKDDKDYHLANNEHEPDNPRPGYLEFAYGPFTGKLATQTNTTANIDKQTSGYHFKQLHFAYYSEFFPFGIEYDSHGGNFPTTTYFQQVVSSKETVTNISLLYRFRPIWGHLAFSGKVTSLSDAFTTDNTDASVISTKTSGLGLGARMAWEFAKPTWKPDEDEDEFFLKLQNVWAEYVQYLSVKAVDQGLSRGETSNGSSGSQYRLGFTLIAYLDFIPLLKRWVIEPSYGSRSYSLKFQGATISESGNINGRIIPGGTGKETETDYAILIGLRFEDPLKGLFGKKEKTP